MERREFLKRSFLVAGSLALLPLVGIGKAHAAASGEEVKFKTAYDAIVGGKPVTEGKIAIEAPDTADNGLSVPLAITVDHPMDEDNYIKAIHILTEKNKNTNVATVHLTPMSGEAFYDTRIKLGGTQDVIVIAESSKGTLFVGKKHIKTLTSGCG